MKLEGSDLICYDLFCTLKDIEGIKYYKENHKDFNIKQFCEDLNIPIEVGKKEYEEIELNEFRLRTIFTDDEIEIIFKRLCDYFGEEEGKLVFNE